MTQPWHSRQEDNAWPVSIPWLPLPAARAYLNLSKLDHVNIFFVSVHGFGHGCLYRRMCRSTGVVPEVQVKPRQENREDGAIINRIHTTDDETQSSTRRRSTV
eukprot:scaffold50251_cov19-Prasinocladus_malaysianus.AAC.1